MNPSDIRELVFHLQNKRSIVTFIFMKCFRNSSINKKTCQENIIDFRRIQKKKGLKHGL